MTTYLADHDAECARCDTSPCVVVHDPEPTGQKAHFTGLCGVCFFKDRTMVDPELWNDDLEATE
jgi:hypothetical protein